MIKESKYCSHVLKKYFTKELVIIKEDDENFERSTKYWICDSTFVKVGFKVRDHCQVTEKFRHPAHRDCYINVSLNYKFLSEFHNLRNYDAYLFMQQLGKFNFKINVISNSLQKYMGFSLDISYVS